MLALLQGHDASSPEQAKKQLDSHFDWLLNGTASFQQPSEASRKLLNDNKAVTIKGKKFAIEPLLRPATLKLSLLLVCWQQIDELWGRRRTMQPCSQTQQLVVTVQQAAVVITRALQPCDDHLHCSGVCSCADYTPAWCPTSCVQDLDELQAHILLKRWLRDTGQDTLLEGTAPGTQVEFGLDAMLQVLAYYHEERLMLLKCTQYVLLQGVRAWLSAGRRSWALVMGIQLIGGDCAPQLGLIHLMSPPVSVATGQH